MSGNIHRRHEGSVCDSPLRKQPRYGSPSQLKTGFVTPPRQVSRPPCPFLSLIPLTRITAFLPLRDRRNFRLVSRQFLIAEGLEWAQRKEMNVPFLLATLLGPPHGPASHNHHPANFGVPYISPPPPTTLAPLAPTTHSQGTAWNEGVCQPSSSHNYQLSFIPSGFFSDSLAFTCIDWKSRKSPPGDGIPSYTTPSTSKTGWSGMEEDGASFTESRGRLKGGWLQTSNNWLTHRCCTSWDGFVKGECGRHDENCEGLRGERRCDCSLLSLANHHTLALSLLVPHLSLLLSSLTAPLTRLSFNGNSFICLSPEGLEKFLTRRQLFRTVTHLDLRSALLSWKTLECVGELCSGVEELWLNPVLVEGVEEEERDEDWDTHNYSSPTKVPGLSWKKERSLSEESLLLAYYFNRNDVAMKGFFKMFKKAGEEEYSHATGLMDYMLKRGNPVLFSNISVPCAGELFEGDNDIPRFDPSVKKECHSLQSKIRRNPSAVEESQVGCEWGDPLSATVAARQLEINVYRHLKRVHNQADKLRDTITQDFLDEYLKEQVDSIKELSDLITTLKRTEPCLGYHIIDKELENAK